VESLDLAVRLREIQHIECKKCQLLTHEASLFGAMKLLTEAEACLEGIA
jgi:hypothetical protein